MITVAVPELTRQHAEHSDFVPGCGICRFDFEFKLATQERSGPLPRWWDVSLKFGDEERIDYGKDYVGAWHRLAALGYTETYWNWDHSYYHGGNNVWGATQEFHHNHTFRNPTSEEWVWLGFKEERHNEG